MRASKPLNRNPKHYTLQVQATAAMAVAGRHVEQFFVGPSPHVQPTMDLNAKPPTLGVEAQFQRLAEGVVFAFVCACAGEGPAWLEEIVLRAAATMNDAEWNENCAKTRAGLAERAAELERARDGVTNMLAEVPEWSVRPDNPPVSSSSAAEGPRSTSLALLNGRG